MPRPPTALAVALGTALALASAAEKKPSVTRANFNAALAEHAVTLIAFTAPWCGHCKKLKPELAAAEPALSADGIGVLEVDATQERELAKEFGVRGFPDLFVHRRDLSVFNRFNGQRTAQGIAQYMKRRVGDACRALEDEGQIEEFLDVGTDLDRPRIRLFAEPAEPASDADAGAPTVLPRDSIERAVERVRDQIPCAMPPWSPGAVEYAARVRLASTFEGTLEYTGAPNATALWRWLQLRSRPTVAELSERTARMYVGERDSGVAIAMLPSPLAGRDEAQRAYYEKELREVAEALRPLDGPNVFVTYCRAPSPLCAQLGADYKVDPAVPSLLVLDFTRRQRKPPGYLMPGPFEVKGAIAHIAAFKAGELAPVEGALTRLLARFDDVVLWVAEHTLEFGAALGLTTALVIFLTCCLGPPARAAARGAAPAAAAEPAGATGASEGKASDAAAAGAAADDGDETKKDQ